MHLLLTLYSFVLLFVLWAGPVLVVVAFRSTMCQVNNQQDWVVPADSQEAAALVDLVVKLKFLMVIPAGNPDHWIMEDLSIRSSKD